MSKSHHNGSTRSLNLATGFLLLFICTGIVMGVGRAFMEIGWSPDTIRDYYMGSEEAMTYPKEFPELMETTHVHFFMIPMIYFILCYLFAQSGTTARNKSFLICLTYLNVAGFLAAPYIIRYFSPGLSLIMPIHGLVLILSAGALTYFPLRDALRRHT